MKTRKSTHRKTHRRTNPLVASFKAGVRHWMNNIKTVLIWIGIFAVLYIALTWRG